jgi:hypothetical protein
MPNVSDRGEWTTIDYINYIIGIKEDEDSEHDG